MQKVRCPLAVVRCLLSVVQIFLYGKNTHIFSVSKSFNLIYIFLANESVDVKGIARKDLASKKYDFIGVFGG